MVLLEIRISLLLVVLSYCFQEGLTWNLVTKRRDNYTLLQYRFSPDRMTGCSMKTALMIAKSPKGEDTTRRKISPYYVTTKSLSFCRPSGRVDKEHYMASTIHVIKISRLNEEYRGTGIVPLDVKIHKVIWVLSILAGGVLTPIHSEENRNPCSSIMFSTFAGFFTKLDSNCVIKRGNYTVNGLNINTLSHIFTGDNFIHETFRSELEFFSSKGSIFCANSIFESKSFKRLRKPKKIN